ncbi:MAG: tetratricopeptide repeat protein [Paludibaculum sp.]
MSTLAQQGFQHFYNLEYEQASVCFRQEITTRPADADGYNHMAQLILYRAMYRSGLLENSLTNGDDVVMALIRQPNLVLTSDEDREFHSYIVSATEKANTLLARNSEDADALYALGVAHGLKASYDFLVRKAWFSSLRESSSARKLHARAAELDPLNIDALLMHGVQQYAIACLPAALRMLGAVAGLRGDREAGLRTIERVAREGNNSAVEARLLLFTLYRHEKKLTPALTTIQGLQRDFPRNYLLSLGEIYTLAEMKDERGTFAALHALEQKHRDSAPGYSALHAAKVDYTRGVVQRRFGHLDQALESMNRAATTAPRTDGGTQLLAYEQLGIIHDLKGNRPQAVEAYRKVVDTAPNSRVAKESRGYLARPFQASGVD